MSVSPTAFLEEARRHAGRDDEIGLRTAVSRAYYAAYHNALAVSHECPDPPPRSNPEGEGMHARLIRRFTGVPRKGFKGAALAKQIGFNLGQARALRVRADYELNKTVNANDARRQIDSAEKIATLIEQFSETRKAGAEPS